MGQLFERSGLTPMAGRVFALLMLAEPPYLEFFAIQNALQASKSAVSNAISMLHQQRGLVSYRTFPGDRKRYFYVDFDSLMKDTRKQIAATSQTKQLFEQILKLRTGDQDEAFDAKLQTMVDFFEHLDEGLLEVMSAWDNEQRAK